MYEVPDDPYCYRGTSVLKNRRNLRSQVELEKFETLSVAQRFGEPLPRGRLGHAHYRRIHRHLFQDVYSWAGRIRRVRISKDGSMFCYPENIDREMRRVFGELEAENNLRDLVPEEFARNAAHVLAELNAIHPFREGNGRSLNAFLVVVASQAGHPLDISRLEPADMLGAMVASFNGDEEPLAKLILSIVRSR
jgi:cell filamentation protein